MSDSFDHDAFDHDAFSSFDAWEPLFKARKAKGLDKWSRLKNISEKLQGKDVKAISFTCAHPSHAGEPVRHLLGSVEGNLHFLLGYGNPRFHLAEYHWQIIDPNSTDEEASETYSRMRHPSNPVLWSKAGLDVGDEGDTAQGEPHPLAKKTKLKEQADAQRKAEEIRASTPTGEYVAYPSEGLVESLNNNQVYRWDLVKDTFFSSFNPELKEAMEASAVQKSQQQVVFREGVPDEIRRYAAQFRGEDFDLTVWPLVKSRMSAPGSVLKLETDTAERIYGIVTPARLEFYGRDAKPVEVSVFDRAYKSFDLIPDGNVPPAALSSFIVKHFRVNASMLAEIAKSSSEYKVDRTPQYVEGEPSQGWDTIPAEYVDLVKSVVIDGDTLRVVSS